MVIMPSSLGRLTAMKNKRDRLNNIIRKSKLLSSLKSDNLEDFKYIVSFHHDPEFFKKELCILETINFEFDKLEIDNSDYLYKAIENDSVRIFEYLTKCANEVYLPQTVNDMLTAIGSLSALQATRILNFIMKSGLINPFNDIETKNSQEKNLIKDTVSSLIKYNKKELLDIYINNGLDLRKFEHDFTNDIRTNYPNTDNNTSAENMIKFLVKNGSKYDSVLRGIEKGIHSTELTMFVLHQNAKEKQETQ